MRTRVKCKSGLTGWQCRLQYNYTDFEHFKSYSDIYALAEKLGYDSAEDAWDDNPLIQGSVDPSDFCKVDN